jgi:hypothetical protein
LMPMGRRKRHDRILAPGDKTTSDQHHIHLEWFQLF